MSGTGGAFAPPAPGVTVLTTAPAGGWTQVTDPHAIYYNGVVYFGYIRGDNGDVVVRTYTHSTGVVSAETVLHAALEVDLHDAPSLFVRTDGRIMAFYSAHNGVAMYLRISTNAEDISAFGAEVNLDSQLGGTAYTYPTVFQSLGYPGAPIVLIYRDFVSPSGKMCLSTSTDDGVTWAAQTVIFQNIGKVPYFVVESDGVSRFDVAVSDGHPITDAPTKVYHFYNQSGSFLKSDGTSAGSLPLTPASVTEVYDGAAGSGWPSSIADGPVFTYEVFLGGASHSYRYAYWTGSAWSLNPIVSAGGELEGAAPHVSIDRSLPASVYTSVKVGSFWETQRRATPDNGATGTRMENVTTGSAVDNILPVNVRYHTSYPRMLFLAGTYTTYLNNSLAVKAA